MASTPSSTAWVINPITSTLKPGRPKAVSSVAQYKRDTEDPPLYCLRHPPLSALEYAKLAFSLFKKTDEFASVAHLADFEVSEALGASRALFKFSNNTGVLDWCHVSFYIAASDSVKQLCFAELVDFSLGDLLLLNSFSFADVDCSEISHGCGFCPPTRSYPHPPSFAFTAGHSHIDMDKQDKLASTFRRQVVKNEALSRSGISMFCLCNLPSHGPKKWAFDPSLYTPMLREEDYAATALDLIREKEGKDYKLVNPFYARCLVLPSTEDGFVLWCHVALLAKVDGDLVRFFVEMKDKGEKKFVLNGYCSFDLDDPDLMEGCGICPKSKDLPHPSHMCIPSIFTDYRR